MMAYTTAAHEYASQRSGQRGARGSREGRRTLCVGCDVEGYDAQVNNTDVPRVVHLSREGMGHVRIKEQAGGVVRCALSVGSTTPPFSCGIIAVVPAVSVRPQDAE